MDNCPLLVEYVKNKMLAYPGAVFRIAVGAIVVSSRDCESFNKCYLTWFYSPPRHIRGDIKCRKCCGMFDALIPPTATLLQRAWIISNTPADICCIESCMIGRNHLRTSRRQIYSPNWNTCVHCRRDHCADVSQAAGKWQMICEIYGRDVGGIIVWMMARLP
jgi:hypothetical protein